VTLWHQTRDLLTVRYSTLRGRKTPGLRGANAKSDTQYHSGLTADELDHDDRLLKTYRAVMRQIMADR
jgi:hypothetical protein